MSKGNFLISGELVELEYFYLNKKSLAIDFREVYIHYRILHCLHLFLSMGHFLFSWHFLSGGNFLISGELVELE